MMFWCDRGDQEHIALGEEAISEGKVGCIILSGGDGTRLGYEGPKGLVEVGDKSLLAHLLQKGRKESPMGIMTSSKNHDAIKAAVPDDISCFEQDDLPLLDTENRPTHLYAPSGNGDLFASFVRSGLFELWQERGVEWINVIPVDNLLADPFDSNLIGYGIKTNADCVLKGINEFQQHEKLGKMFEKNGKIEIVEYTDPSSSNGLVAYSGMLCFSLQAFKKGAKRSLPVHTVKKRYHHKDYLKQETYIFDALACLETIKVLLYPREEVFSPIKTPEDLRLAIRSVSFT